MPTAPEQAATVSVGVDELAALRLDADRYRRLRELGWYIDSAAKALEMIPPRRPWADKPPRPDWDEVEDALDVLISGRDDYVSDYNYELPIERKPPQ